MWDMRGSRGRGIGMLFGRSGGGVRRGNEMGGMREMGEKGKVD